MSLEDRIRNLPREIEPERDLFDDIRRRIENEEAARALEVRREPTKGGWRDAIASLFPRPFAAAGVGAGLMAATALMVFALMAPPSGPLTDHEIAEIASRVRERDGVAHVQASVASLLEARRDAIPPEALVAIERSLRDIDRAIAEIHLALLENPDHPSLGYMLAEAYQREAQLLEQLEWWTNRGGAVGDGPATSQIPGREVLS